MVWLELCVDFVWYLDCVRPWYGRLVWLHIVLPSTISYAVLISRVPTGGSCESVSELTGSECPLHDGTEKEAESKKIEAVSEHSPTTATQIHEAA